MDKCIFCKIADHEIQARVEYEDDEIIAFHDTNSAAPVHILIIPKRHIPGVADLTESDRDVVGGIMQVAKKLAEEQSIVEDGYRVVVNQGRNAGQSVPHMHFHLLGGRSMDWPPG